MASAHLPFSQACENNKDAILSQLRSVFSNSKSVLEVGSGTGQHATYFAAQLPHLCWQPTEMAQNLAVLHPRCAEYEGTNLLPEQALDVWDEPWCVDISDAMFSANTLHIMSLASVQRFFDVIGRDRPDDFVLVVYGPFNYGGQYTSDSNSRFDIWLAEQHHESAIRDFETVNGFAAAAGLVLERDFEMPANNRLLVWRTTR